MENANGSAQRNVPPIIEGALSIDRWLAREDMAVETTFKALKRRRSRRKAIARDEPKLAPHESLLMADGTLAEGVSIRRLQWEALVLHREIVWKMRRALMESELRLADREREWAECDDDE